MSLFRCVECQRDLDERIETIWSGVTGWEKKRDQGGTNHVALRKPTGEFMCNVCMSRMLSGLSTMQESLL